MNMDAASMSCRIEKKFTWIQFAYTCSFSQNLIIVTENEMKPANDYYPDYIIKIPIILIIE